MNYHSFVYKCIDTSKDWDIPLEAYAFSQRNDPANALFIEQVQKYFSTIDQKKCLNDLLFENYLSLDYEISAGIVANHPKFCAKLGYITELKEKLPNTDFYLPLCSQKFLSNVYPKQHDVTDLFVAWRELYERVVRSAIPHQSIFNKIYKRAIKDLRIVVLNVIIEDQEHMFDPQYIYYSGLLEHLSALYDRKPKSPLVKEELTWVTQHYGELPVVEDMDLLL